MKSTDNVAIERPRVALLIETSNSYARGLLQGIHRYQQEHDSWSIYLPEQGRGDAPPPWLKNWQGEGIIARIENRRIADAVLSVGVPVVDVSAGRFVPHLPWVETDDDAIAEIAASHLLERGLTNFAFCGDDTFQWSIWRRDRFVAVVEQAGHRCYIFPPKQSVHLSQRPHDVALARWIESLPKPVGVLACYDGLARQVLDVCRQLNILVPDDVAVIGVDNDELLCNLSEPPLTSVEPDAPRAGYEAAALLASLLAGKKIPEGTAVRVPPNGIVTRRSTDMYAVDDPDVAAAMRFIRQHACEGIKVEDVLAVVSLSRSVLESRFLKLVGRTPHDEIARVRLERVAALLTHSDLGLAEIADRTGFKHVENLSAAFKKQAGMSPSEYRTRAASKE